MTEITSRLSTALADRYRLERHLGEGGMATVYLAHDLKHDRKVAVKVLRPELSAILGGERFLNEIKVTANLQHPNILALYDSGEADTFLYYVMPYLEGQSLRDKLSREKQLSVDETLKIADSVAAALEYAHQHGVIHRDIKPENILLQSGQALVADFGIALAVSQAGGTRLTETGLSLGTPHYMSPEQATGDRELDARSDVYSLGAMVYEMLVGEPPHVGNSVQAIIAKILSDTPAPITRARELVPPNVDAAVHRAIAKSPADRFVSAAQFAEALANSAYTLPTASAVAAQEVSPRGLAWIRSRAVAWGVAAVMTVLWAWTLSRPEPPRPISRYSIALPGDQGMMGGRGSRVALSPDGTRLVYIGAGDGGTRLWMRRRDQLRATALPGTDAGRNPFFSPDGSRVGFTTAGIQRIKVMSLAGGPPITVVDSGVGADGAVWGVDGFLYFDGLTGQGTTGIMRVRLDGGATEPVTTVDTASGEQDHVWPAVLPNGRGMLFTVVRGADLSEADIAALDFDTGTYQLLARGVRAKYAASGHIVYVTADGFLMAAPFDQDRREITGEAAAIIEGLGVGILGAVDFTLSQAGTLVYLTGAQVTEPSELVWVSREGRADEIDPGWMGDFRTLALSPDGRQLAVSIVESQPFQHQLWVKQLPGGPLAKLTFDGNLNRTPAWSLDGRTVTFVSDRGGINELFVKRADGSATAEVLQQHEFPISEVSWTTDGQWLVFRTGGSSGIYAIRPDRDTIPLPLVVTPVAEANPAVSPDGRWLAYTSDESGRFEVYVRPFPNADDAKWLVSTSGGGGPKWAHSGRELFYESAALELVAVEVVPGETFVMGERRVLFSTQGYIGPYDLTADDQQFVMIRLTGAGQSGELIVVENWFEELKERVGNE